jgi:RimJ/RimL family protein N-acetyltransferase
VTLETERLVLDQWQADDWIAFRPIATDPEVMRYINGGVPWSDEEIRLFVERQIALYRERGFCRWKLTERTSGALIGLCGVGRWRGYPELEIGWWLGREWWGRGLATEAARTALEDVFTRAKLDHVISIARPENVASIRIMQKLGMRFVRAFENDGVSLVQYAIERSAR